MSLSSTRVASGPGRLVQWDWERGAPGSDTESFGFTSAEITDVLTKVGFEGISVGIGFEVEVDGKKMAPLMGVGKRPQPTA